MFDKILVALDVSELGQHVFNEALSVAKQLNATLMLLHVLSFDEDGSPTLPGLYGLEYYPAISTEALEAYQKQWEDFRNEGLSFLRLRSEEAIAAGVPAEFTQSAGNPGPAICQLATTWGANLIIVGRRGRSGLSEMLLGSVSNYVLHHAPCSVLTIHRPPAPSANKSDTAAVAAQN